MSSDYFPCILLLSAAVMLYLRVTFHLSLCNVNNLHSSLVLPVPLLSMPTAEPILLLAAPWLVLRQLGLTPD